MATTIITKHGSGVPSTLEVGELAIDKAEPAIYTNTGSGVEKIGTAASGGGGGSLSPLEIDFRHPSTKITFSGAPGVYSSAFKNDSNRRKGIRIQTNSSSAISTSNRITMTANSGHEFLIFIKPSHLSAENIPNSPICRLTMINFGMTSGGIYWQMQAYNVGYPGNNPLFKTGSTMNNGNTGQFSVDATTEFWNGVTPTGGNLTTTVAVTNKIDLYPTAPTQFETSGNLTLFDVHMRSTG